MECSRVGLRTFPACRIGSDSIPIVISAIGVLICELFSPLILAVNTLKDLDFGRESGITVIGMSRWVEDRASVAGMIQEFRARLGDDECYLTLDVDACDPSCAPGTGTPVSGGFTSAELFLALRWLAGIRLAGADVVEVCPSRDPQGITALLAAQAAFQILCIDAAAHPE